MLIKQDTKLDYPDVLFEPQRSDMTTRNQPLTRTLKFPHTSTVWTGVPIMASNMDGVGTFSMAKALYKHHMLTVIRKHYTIEEWDKFIDEHSDSGIFNHMAVSTGTNAIFSSDAQDYATLQHVMSRTPIPFICIDVANGYHQVFVDFCKRVRDDYPDKIIMAGNVVTDNMVEELIRNGGVDVVKVGIGPGSACTTRLVTGVGVPQFSAVVECASAAHGQDGCIIADGGCCEPGDVAKAFGGGADFVMLGGMLAGYDEGEYHDCENGKVRFYGMSSEAAHEAHGHRKDGYKTTEGRVLELPYRGKVEKQIQYILGGIRSNMTYIGARRLKDISKCAVFVRVQNTHNRIYEGMDV
jgi:GMP reductase